jgi:hypothetical protein
LGACDAADVALIRFFWAHVLERFEVWADEGA